MSPPTEQLVRDYLNRLSVAARGKLTEPDRQALLERTRVRIEAECGGVQGSGTPRVRRALAGLGDPMAVVEEERARIAADPEAEAEQVPVGVAASNDPESSANGSLPRRQPGSGPRPGRRTASPDSRVPRQPRSPESVDPAGPAAPDLPNPPGPQADDPPDPPTLPDQPEEAPEPEPEIVRPDDPDLAAAAGPDFESDVVDAEIVPDGLPVRVVRGARHRITAFAIRVATLVRRYPFETAAAALLGVGTAVYPPLWPLGALGALAGKAWDRRDKWIGVAAPAGLVILGSVLVPALGGQHGALASYGYAVWLAIGRLSRVAAPVGACYLSWRLHRGRRQPRVPPWNVPRRFGGPRAG
jgi:hypothetical protein